MFIHNSAHKNDSLSFSVSFFKVKMLRQKNRWITTHELEKKSFSVREISLLLLLDTECRKNDKKNLLSIYTRKITINKGYWETMSRQNADERSLWSWLKYNLIDQWKFAVLEEENILFRMQQHWTFAKELGELRNIDELSKSRSVYVAFGQMIEVRIR